MSISVFQLFSIGIGPSSSHTVGPMKAARQFVLSLKKNGLLENTAQLKIDLYGSLALTGKGHGTDIAIMLGLQGETPDKIEPKAIREKIIEIHRENALFILGEKKIGFKEDQLVFHYDKQLPYHPNGLRFLAYDEKGKELTSQIFYSVGGGFIVSHEQASKDQHLGEDDHHKIPYPFKTAAELLKICRDNHLRIRDVMMENEKSWRSEKEIYDGLLLIWQVMQECVEQGCRIGGILPGGLGVKRRAASLYLKLMERKKSGHKDPSEIFEWVSLWALAVNEENAAGGRVVTAPTNGAAGIIPAVMLYYQKMTENPSNEGIVTFLLTAGAIGILYKEGASISAAEMGCMGEVGVACSMAAAGLTAAMNGSNEQVENAAEIGMEHNLGLTCDPIKGLVQIPCIERNTMGAIKAINAELLAMQGDGVHRVSLDQVIATMRQTGRDMKSIYKETSLGGLAVNVPEC